MKVTGRKFRKSTGVLLALLMIAASGCAENKQSEEAHVKADKAVQAISSVEEFDNAISAAKDTLVMVDLYADWCAPCRQLAPTLEVIASEKRDQVKTYKVNVDNLRALAVRYNVTGIPYVVFIKNGKFITSLTGLRNKAAYVSVIDQYSPKPEN